MEYPFDLDLQLFAGEGGDGAGTGADGAAMGGEAGMAAPEAAPEPRKRSRTNPLAGVRYGVQPEAQQAGGQGEARRDDGAAAGADLAAEWAEAKKGRFKAQFDADVQAIVKDRLKNAKNQEAQLKALSPILDRLGKKYGKEATDIQGIVDAYTNDDELYADEAMEKGMPVEAVKAMHQLQEMRAQREEAERVSAEEQMFQQHFQTLSMQAEALKAQFPEFDLMTELQNERFRNMTSPSGGVSVADAFYAIHHQELEAAQMRHAASQTKMQVSQAIQAGRNRPTENGANAAAQGLDVRADPSKFTKADFAEIRRRAARGEKISF